MYDAATEQFYVPDGAFVKRFELKLSAKENGKSLSLVRLQHVDKVRIVTRNKKKSYDRVVRTGPCGNYDHVG